MLKCAKIYDTKYYLLTTVEVLIELKMAHEMHCSGDSIHQTLGFLFIYFFLNPYTSDHFLPLKGSSVGRILLFSRKEWGICSFWGPFSRLRSAWVEFLVLSE